MQASTNTGRKSKAKPLHASTAPTKGRSRPAKAPTPAPAPSTSAQAPQAPQANVPGTPGFVERRRDRQSRRADDRSAPVVNTEALAAAVEERIKDTLDKALHKGIQVAMREAVGSAAFNDANLQPRNAPAKSAKPQPPAPQEDKEPPVVRNGVKCPEYGTIAGQLWLLYGKAGAGVTLAQAKELARQAGLNETSAAISLYNWRKFHGVVAPK